MSDINITEKENKNGAKVQASKQIIDNIIDEEIPYPFSKKNATYLIIGGQGTGKSTFISSIATATKKKCRVWSKKFNKVYYFTPENAFSSEKYHCFKDHDKVYHELTSNSLDEVMDEMEEDKSPKFNNLIIIDDFSEELRQKGRFEKVLNKLLYKHRHYNATVVLSVLHLRSIGVPFRKLIDYTILFKNKSLKELQDYIIELLPYNMKEVKKIFDYVFDKPYNFLFINNRTGTLHKNMNRLLIDKTDDKKK